ncbi:unnamed protein product [Peniophora sp. CBMAI 1063]|nr:unnamed protein product [Peniophora sp. CBMAI 1063]
MPHAYGALSAVPRPDPLISAYEARMASLTQEIEKHTGSVAGIFDRTESILELLLRDIRSKRNATLPYISRLPPELMSIIFTIIAAENPPHQPADSDARDTFRNRMMPAQRDDSSWDQAILAEAFEPGSLGWIKLAHVCQSWRNMIHGMASLWAGVLGRLPMADEEALERAGDRASLSLTTVDAPFCLETPRILRTLATGYKYERLRSLRLIQISGILVSGEPELIRVPSASRTLNWTTLEILEVLYFQQLGGSRDFTPLEPILAPSLRIARFIGYVLPFRSISLVELSIKRGNGLPLMITAEALFEILQAASSTLEVLEIHNALSYNFHEEAHAVVEPVNLPQLKILRFMDIQERCHIIFLGLLILPPTIHLDSDVLIGMGDETIRMSSEEVLKPLISAISASGHTNECSYLVISPDSYPEAICFGIYPTILDVHSESTNSDPFRVRTEAKLKLRIANESSYMGSLAMTFAETARWLVPTRFVALSFSTFDNWSHNDISEAMSQFTSLRMLQVFDPLQYCNPSRYPNPGAFPFLSAQLSSPSLQPGIEAKASDDIEGHVLDLLSLVQTEHPKTIDCVAWCSVLVRRLKCVFSDRHSAYYAAGSAKPIRVLRVNYPSVASNNDNDERVARTIFADIAATVEWIVR